MTPGNQTVTPTTDQPRQPGAPRTSSCGVASGPTGTAGSATTRSRRVSTPRGACPAHLHDPREIERLRIPVDVYVGIIEKNVAEYDAAVRYAVVRP